ncbi:MAG TPA: hypothetical protein VGC27_13080 [Rhizomicrobium sp.]
MATAPIAPETAPAGSHRRIFESRYRALPQEAREQTAATASEPDLSALCYDPVPAVIRGILDNPLAGLAHARLIAAHHPNPIGLQAVAARLVFAQDREVQRLFLRNIQTPVSVVRSVFGSRRLTDIFNFSRSHDLPDRHRETARATLKQRFLTAPPEERADLIVATEGRTLTMLSGLPLDGPTVSLLCARGTLSMPLIENLARWPATPPKLIVHLLKQPLVGQFPALKQAVRRHPNCPSNA